MTQPVAPQRHHTWTAGLESAGDWFLFAGSAPEAERRLPIGAPTGDLWPLPDLVHLAESTDRVAVILAAWERHLAGYRLFNAEAPGTRWLRFGCGNIETWDPATGTRVQLRVDNTKSLPGIDRTDDIKKGIAAVMLFGRLKKGCRARAVKTVLFGNLYAETHHEHYVKPLSSLRLMWPDEAPVNLFDAIIALSRNIINDPAVEKLVGLASEPYAADTVDVAALAEGLFADEPDA